MFIAHPVPEVARNELQRQLAPYRKRHPDVRWTHPQTWHLTLLFLGAVHAARVPGLQVLVEQVAAGRSPYRVTANLGGGRARGRDGVAWLGLSEGAAELIGMANELAEACPADITEGAPAKRTPSAHLTLVRRADAAVIGTLREQALGPLGVAWEVDRMSLIRSHLEPGGARYETLSERRLYAHASPFRRIQ